jgi:hypothetical protein
MVGASYITNLTIMATKIFVNLPVKDLARAVEFFTKLGYKFNPDFTDEKAACLVIGDNIYAMLLTEQFFKSFNKKGIVNTKKDAEVMLALSVNSREEVDQMMEKVLAAGGTEPKKAEDYGWMYGRDFEDLDGHIWEVFYMDESKRPKA